MIYLNLVVLKDYLYSLSYLFFIKTWYLLFLKMLYNYQNHWASEEIYRLLRKNLVSYKVKNLSYVFHFLFSLKINKLEKLIFWILKDVYKSKLILNYPVIYFFQVIFYLYFLFLEILIFDLKYIYFVWVHLFFIYFFKFHQLNILGILITLKF